MPKNEIPQLFTLSLFTLSHRTKEITVGESPTNKKADNFCYPLVGHLGLEPRTSRL